MTFKPRNIFPLQETGVRAIQIMLGSTRKIVQVPALELVRNVIRVPGGLNLAAGDALLVANQSLIQQSRVPAAITRIVRADIELKPSPTFYVATTAVETIAVLLTSALPTCYVHVCKLPH